MCGRLPTTNAIAVGASANRIASVNVVQAVVNATAVAANETKASAHSGRESWKSIGWIQMREGGGEACGVAAPIGPACSTGFAVASWWRETGGSAKEFSAFSEHAAWKSYTLKE